MLLDAQTTRGKFCPERNKSFPEAEEKGQRNNYIYKTSQMNMENSPGDTDLARERMSERLFPYKEKAVVGLQEREKERLLDQRAVADAERQVLLSSKSGSAIL